MPLTTLCTAWKPNFWLLTTGSAKSLQSWAIFPFVVPQNTIGTFQPHPFPLLWCAMRTPDMGQTPKGHHYARNTPRQHSRFLYGR